MGMSIVLQVFGHISTFRVDGKVEINDLNIIQRGNDIVFTKSSRFFLAGLQVWTWCLDKGKRQEIFKMERFHGSGSNGSLAISISHQGHFKNQQLAIVSKNMEKFSNNMEYRC